MVDLPTASNLLASWWFDYDSVSSESWPVYFTGDASFACRSDSGQSPVEDMLRADLRGRDEVVAWHKAHRRMSPYPLRHHVTNVHLTAVRAQEADYRCYLLVTTMAGGRVVSSASGLCLGTIRLDDGAARFADMQVILDFIDSRILAEIQEPASSPASRW